MFNQSWDAPQGNGNGGEKRTYTFWLRPGEAKRIIFLQDAPIQVWEHELYVLTKKSESHVCPVRNKIGDHCAICDLSDEIKKDKGLWPRLVGYSTVLDIGMVEWRNGEVMITPPVDRDGNPRPEFMGSKRLFRGKWGSEEKPSTWRILADKRQRIGTLMFTVWDVKRLGNKDPRVGSTFEFVTKLDSKEAVLEYLKSMGVPTDRISADLVEMINYSQELKPLSDQYITGILATAGLISAPVASESAPNFGVPLSDATGGNTVDDPFDM